MLHYFVFITLIISTTQINVYLSLLHISCCSAYNHNVRSHQSSIVLLTFMKAFVTVGTIVKLVIIIIIIIVVVATVFVVPVEVI